MKSYKWVTREEMLQNGFVLDADLDEPAIEEKNKDEREPGSPPPKSG